MEVAFLRSAVLEWRGRACQGVVVVKVINNGDGDHDSIGVWWQKCMMMVMVVVPNYPMQPPSALTDCFLCADTNKLSDRVFQVQYTDF